MATISVNELAVLDPVLTQATEGPSPTEEKIIEATQARGIANRLASSPMSGPTSRQRTQSEILDVELTRWRSMDPFSVRYIPFQQLREMTTDLMLGFGWYMTMAPLIRANWLIECIAEGEQVLMADGTRRSVEDLRPGDEVLSSDGKTISTDEVVRIWFTGRRPVLKISLSDGRVLRVTDNHPIHSWDRWIKAGDLHIGDAVAVPRLQYEQDGDLSCDDAFLLALWLAEGSKTKQMYQAISYCEEIQARVAGIAAQRGWKYSRERSNVIRLSSWHQRHDGTPFALLKKYGCWGQATHEIRVPESVMRATNEVVADFLGTYIACDGFVHRRMVGIVSTSERMIRDLHILCARFGITPTIQTMQPTPSHHRRQWKLLIKGTDNIGRLLDSVYIAGKQHRLVRAYELCGGRTVDRSFPPQWREHLLSTVGSLRAKGLNVRSGPASADAWASRRIVEQVAELEGSNSMLAERCNGGLGWAVVTSVVHDGIENVYDFTTATHSALFLESGLVHNSPDAQLAAALDEAFRPIASATYLNFSNDLWYGHQPLVKRFKLGKLGGSYRDPGAADPSADVPIWTSSADVVLWKPPLALNPSHCLPIWNEDGEMIGIKFSTLPIPNFDLISAASAYGYEVVPGKVIDSDYAMWSVNEAELNFGSVYGSSRTKRAYRYWWSYWYRWALADRAFEHSVDPAKIIYFPTDFDEFIDSEDPDDNKISKIREVAIRTAESARSGAAVALPGDVVEGPDGRPTTMRKWSLEYLASKANFTELDQTFAHLDTLKLRSWMIPEQAFIEGRGSTSSRNVAVQLGEVYQESQQLLIDRFDAQASDHMFAQWIAVNMPEKIGTPARRVSHGLGAIDEQVLQTILTLVGQVRGNFLPVDMYTLLHQLKVPLLNEKQWKQELKNIADLAAIGGPPVSQPTPRGTQGYNAGVEKTPMGETRYFVPPQRILLADSDGFMNSLPDTPHYRDAGVRSAILRLRRLLIDRYGEQYASLAKHLETQHALFLAAEPPQQQQGLSKQDSKRVASRIIDAWALEHAAGIVGSPIEAMRDGESAPARFGSLIGKIALAGGTGALKGARLAADDFGAEILAPWVAKRVGTSLDSIDSTVRSEAQEWLEGQLQQTVDPAAVATAAREHFADFPATHADRVVRTETRDAYNNGALTALHLAGVSQVQAHDASDGTDTLTDAACQARDGQIYTVQDAMKVDEHPNGTLYFTPLSTEALRIERVTELPSHLSDGNGKQVSYDAREEILYLLEAVEPDQERMYLKMLGDQLSYR